MSEGNPNASRRFASGETLLVRGLTLIAALGGLLFGYDTAVISARSAPSTHNFIDPRACPKPAQPALSGWTISCALLGCVIGAGAGRADVAKARRAAACSSRPSSSCCLIGSAYPEFGSARSAASGPDALTPFILYRILGGVGVGVASMLSPLYIAEIAPPAQRGRLRDLQQVAIVVGMTLVYFVNWAIASQGDDQWVLLDGLALHVCPRAIPAGTVSSSAAAGAGNASLAGHERPHRGSSRVLVRLSNENRCARSCCRKSNSRCTTSGKDVPFGPLVMVVGIMPRSSSNHRHQRRALLRAVDVPNIGASTDSALLQTIIVGVATSCSL